MVCSSAPRSYLKARCLIARDARPKCEWTRADPSLFFFLAAFAEVQTKVEKTLKTHNKANNAEGATAVKRLWVKTIIQIEEDAESNWADKKKLHKDNQRALTNVRQTIKKMVAGDYKVPPFSVFFGSPNDTLVMMQALSFFLSFSLNHFLLPFPRAVLDFFSHVSLPS